MSAQAKCHHRVVADDGRVLCGKITRGDREISPAVCAACPAAQCNCAHLRFSLERHDAATVVVRYGNGKTVVWDDRPRGLRFCHAACAERDAAVTSPGDCACCPHHAPLLPQAMAAWAGPASAGVAAVGPQPCGRRAGGRAAGVMGKVIPFPSAGSPLRLGAP